VRLYLNRKAWLPRHWVVLVACVATASVADVAANQGWWSFVAAMLFLILLNCLPRDFVGLKRRHHVAKNQENGWELLVAALMLGVVALALTAMTLGEYSDTSDAMGYGYVVLAALLSAVVWILMAFVLLMEHRRSRAATPEP